MSIVRFSDGTPFPDGYVPEESDVYVWEDEYDQIICSRSRVCEGFVAESSEEMLEHLLEHRAKGHVVPEHALDTLREYNPQ